MGGSLLAMPKFAVRRRLVLTAALVALAYPAFAQDAFDLSVPKADGETAASNLECAGEPLSGSGPGFASSRDDSEEVAIAAWLEKAKAIYPEASWDTAKDANLSCAVQGLYSKCFADGIPCKPKPE